MFFSSFRISSLISWSFMLCQRIRRPPRSTRTDTLFPTRRSSDLLASVVEPWDGPAALAMTGGRWAVAVMDRNALRPLRYTLTDDGLLVVGSETGMVVVPETSVVEKGRLGPGQMIPVDPDEGRVFNDSVTQRNGKTSWRERVG